MENLQVGYENELNFSTVNSAIINDFFWNRLK